MPPLVTLDEYVTINSYIIGTPAAVPDDLAPLWKLADVKGIAGENIPGATGTLARRLIRGPIRTQLPVLVHGNQSDDGTPYADVRAGLATNLAAFDGAVVAPATSSPWTVPIVHTLPDATTRTSACQVLGSSTPSRAGAYTVRVVLDLLIPSGVWVIA